MDNPGGKMRIVAEFDTSKADAAAKSLNQTVANAGASGKVAGETAASAIDKMTAAAMRSQKTFQTLGADLVEVANASKAGAAGLKGITDEATRASAATDKLKQSMADYARQNQQTSKSSGQTPPGRGMGGSGEWDRAFAKAKEDDILRASKAIEAAVSRQQISELAGAERIEAQRRQALATLGQTAELEAKINALYDRRQQVFANKEQGAAAAKAAKENEAQLNKEEQAHKRIDSLIAQSNASQLSAAQRVEAQRKQAINTLGLTEDHVKKINGHFDQLAAKAGSQQLATNIKNFIQNPLGAVSEVAEKAVLSLGTVGVAAAGTALGLAAVGVALKKGADELAAYSLEITNLAARTGLGTTQVQVFSKAAEYAGVNAGVLAQAVRKLNEDLSDGGTESAKITAALGFLGVQLKRTAAGQVDAGAVIDQALRSLSKIPDYYTRAAIAQDLFNRGAKELLPYIDNYDKLNERAKANALILGVDALKAADEYRKSLKDLSNQWDKFIANFTVPTVKVVNVIFKVINDIGGTDDEQRRGQLARAGLGPDGRPLNIYPEEQRAAEAKRLAAENLAKADVLSGAAADQERTRRERAIAGKLGADERVKQLEKDKSSLEERIRIEAAAAAQPLGAVPGRGPVGSSSRTARRDAEKDRQTHLANAQAESRDLDKLKKDIEQAKQDASYEKEAAAAARTATRARQEAEAAEATGMRRIELQAARELEAAETKIGSEGTEFRNRFRAAEAEYAKKLGVERLIEARKEEQEMTALRRKAADDQTTFAVETISRENRLEESGLRGREARGIESYRTIEDARLALFKKTLDAQDALESDRIERHTAADIAELRRVAELGYSKDKAHPEVRARQEKDEGEKEQLRQDQGNRELQTLHGNTAVAKDEATNNLGDERVKRDREFIEETRRYRFQSDTEVQKFQLEQIGARRDRELLAVEEIKAQTLPQKVSLERQKAAIQDSYIRQASDAEKTERRRTYEEEVTQLNQLYTQKGISEDAYRERAAAINQRFNQEEVRRAKEEADQIADARARSTRAVTGIIIDEQHEIFESFRKDADGIFDALTGKSRDVWRSMADLLKSELLGTMKGLFTNSFAALATGAVTGQKVTLEHSNKGGAFGMGSYVPVFAPRSPYAAPPQAVPAPVAVPPASPPQAPSAPSDGSWPKEQLLRDGTGFGNFAPASGPALVKGPSKYETPSSYAPLSDEDVAKMAIPSWSPDQQSNNNTLGVSSGTGITFPDVEVPISAMTGLGKTGRKATAAAAALESANDTPDIGGNTIHGILRVPTAEDAGMLAAQVALSSLPYGKMATGAKGLLKDFVAQATGPASERGSFSLRDTDQSRILYHGTSAPEFTSFTGDLTYLAAEKREAAAYASDPILGGGRAAGRQRTLRVRAAHGSTLDISDAVDAEMSDEGSGDLDAVVAEHAKVARKAGHSYLSFDHPSTDESNEAGIFKAILSLHPQRDLSILPEISAAAQRRVEAAQRRAAPVSPVSAADLAPARGIVGDFIRQATGPASERGSFSLRDSGAYRANAPTPAQFAARDTGDPTTRTGRFVGHRNALNALEALTQGPQAATNGPSEENTVLARKMFAGVNEDFGTEYRAGVYGGPSWDFPYAGPHSATTEAARGGWGTRLFNPRELTATQTWMGAGNIEDQINRLHGQAALNDQPITSFGRVVEHEGTNYLIDGHHRSSGAIFSGREQVPYDFTKVGPAAGRPLPPEVRAQYREDTPQATIDRIARGYWQFQDAGKGGGKGGAVPVPTPVPAAVPALHPLMPSVEEFNAAEAARQQSNAQQQFDADHRYDPPGSETFSQYMDRARAERAENQAVARAAGQSALDHPSPFTIEPSTRVNTWGVSGGSIRQVGSEWHAFHELDNGDLSAKYDNKEDAVAFMQRMHSITDNAARQQAVREAVRQYNSPAPSSSEPAPFSYASRSGETNEGLPIWRYNGPGGYIEQEGDANLFTAFHEADQGRFTHALSLGDATDFMHRRNAEISGAVPQWSYAGLSPSEIQARTAAPPPPPAPPTAPATAPIVFAHAEYPGNHVAVVGYSADQTRVYDQELHHPSWASGYFHDEVMGEDPSYGTRHDLPTPFSPGGTAHPPGMDVNNIVSFSYMARQPSGTLAADGTEVMHSFRQRGIGTQMYDYANAHVGPVVASTSRTERGLGLWHQARAGAAWPVPADATPEYRLLVAQTAVRAREEAAARPHHGALSTLDEMRNAEALASARHHLASLQPPEPPPPAPIIFAHSEYPHDHVGIVAYSADQTKSYDQQAPHPGWAHDYFHDNLMGERPARTTPFGPRGTAHPPGMGVNNIVGFSYMSRNTNGTLEADATEVMPSFQQRGIGTGLYNYANANAGPVVASGNRTQMGMGLWRNTLEGSAWPIPADATPEYRALVAQTEIRERAVAAARNPYARRGPERRAFLIQQDAEQLADARRRHGLAPGDAGEDLTDAEAQSRIESIRQRFAQARAQTFTEVNAAALAAPPVPTTDTTDFTLPQKPEPGPALVQGTSQYETQSSPGITSAVRWAREALRPAPPPVVLSSPAPATQQPAALPTAAASLGAATPSASRFAGLEAAFGFGPRGTYGKPVKTQAPATGADEAAALDSGVASPSDIPGQQDVMAAGPRGFLPGLQALGSSPAVALAGTSLLTDGLGRGQTAGVVEDTAGGLIIGARDGGVEGAALGGALGLAAGLLRRSVASTLAERARQQAKSLYHVNISREASEQIASIAKTQYGGSLAAAMRSQQVLQMVGQHSGIANQPYSTMGPKGQQEITGGPAPASSTSNLRSVGALAIASFAQQLLVPLIPKGRGQAPGQGQPQGQGQGQPGQGQPSFPMNDPGISGRDNPSISLNPLAYFQQSQNAGTPPFIDPSMAGGGGSFAAKPDDQTGNGFLQAIMPGGLVNRTGSTVDGVTTMRQPDPAGPPSPQYEDATGNKWPKELLRPARPERITGGVISPAGTGAGAETLPGGVVADSSEGDPGAYYALAGGAGPDYAGAFLPGQGAAGPGFDQGASTVSQGSPLGTEPGHHITENSNTVVRQIGGALLQSTMGAIGAPGGAAVNKSISGQGQAQSTSQTLTSLAQRMRQQSGQSAVLPGSDNSGGQSQTGQSQANMSQMLSQSKTNLEADFGFGPNGTYDKPHTVQEKTSQGTYDNTSYGDDTGIDAPEDIPAVQNTSVAGDSGFGAAAGSLASSPVAGAAGTALLSDGIQRGGFTGTFEDAAGGALVGEQYGGPVGAAVGAAVGLGIGILRQTVLQTLAEQAVGRVKDLYHIDISKQTGIEIATIAKQQYGGSLAVALHSQQVMQMLGLYAETTGQKFGIVGPQSAGLAFSGGQEVQAGSYHNGSLLGFSSSLSSLTPMSGTIGSPTFDKYGQSPSPVTPSVTVSLDGPSSSKFLQGQTVAAINANPQVVSDAGLNANSMSYNRLQTYATMSSPATLIS